MENNKSTINPKLIISQHFDSLISQVDVYTEETLKNCTDAVDFKFKPYESYKESEKLADVDFDSSDMESYDRQEEYFKKCLRRNENVDVGDNLNRLGQEPIKTLIYVNKMRDELLKELEKGQKEAFEYYETVRDKINKDMSQEEIESIVFANNYYFILTHLGYQNPFKMHLVKLNFYLNSREIELLRYKIKSNFI